MFGDSLYDEYMPNHYCNSPRSGAVPVLVPDGPAARARPSADDGGDCGGEEMRGRWEDGRRRGGVGLKKVVGK